MDEEIEIAEEETEKEEELDKSKNKKHVPLSTYIITVLIFLAIIFSLALLIFVEVIDSREEGCGCASNEEVGMSESR